MMKMKWDKSARLLAVASLALATSAAWGQVKIGTTNPVTGTTYTLAPDGAVTSVKTPTPTNGGAGINASTATQGSASVSNTLSPFGGAGGPGSNLGADSSGVNLNKTWGTGLIGSSHDFVTGTGSSTVKNGAGLCTFCHTPHKAKSTLLLWNHTLSSNTFQWDVAATTSGTALPGFTGNAYNGPSAKCLSCHDGSVAIGDVGWFSEASHTGSNAISTFTVGNAGAPVYDTNGNVQAGSNSKQVGAGGNLSGNHPVAIPYPFNGAPNVYNGSTTGAQLAADEFVGDPTANNIRLYSDVGGGAIVGKTTPGQTGIECSSCHDPHNKASRGDFFLRGSLVGADQPSGYICLQCHIK